MNPIPFLRGSLILALAAAPLALGACGDDDITPDAAVSDAGQPDAAPDSGPDDTGPGDAGPDAPDPDAGDAGPVVTPPVITTTMYDTADQMLLANEINESGEPFAEALGYDLDLLDPAVAGVPDDKAYVLGIENYEYSRYQLGNVVRNSGIGLHMLWAPIIRRRAAAAPDGFDGSVTGTPNGINEDDVLMGMMRNFGMMSGETPPANAWPQFAEFAAGDPHLPQAPDPALFAWEDVATMRWDRSLMDRHLTPAAMGQTMMKQYLWAQDMLSAFHDGDDEGIDADGTNSPDMDGSPMFDPDNNIFYGGDARDGFIGMVLTAQAINKTAFLTGALSYDGTSLGPISLPDYDPADGIRYFPHSIAVTETEVMAGMPPRASEFVVTDASSRTYDQASLLWATTSFVDMMSPGNTSDSAHMAYREVFDGSPFPTAASENGGTPGPYDLMKGTARAIFMNLRAMHFDADVGVFVDEANLADGAVTHGTTVSTLSSAYLIVALETFIAGFTGTPLEGMATMAVQDQADYLVGELSDGSGTYFDEATVGGTHSDARSLSAQAAAVRALYVAARVTGNAGIRTAAGEAYAKLISDYYVEDDGLFRTDPDSATATYTPRNFAVLAGALREASIEGSTVAASDIYTQFFMNVASKMQLAEGGATGETGGDSDGDGIAFVPEQADRLPPVFATQGVFTLSE